MWVVEGLTHRYPTKVLAELLPTCPQYCGHCTRMDLVGNSTPVIPKLKFDLKPVDRYDAMISYLRANPSVRDVVVSGGDVANMPWKNLEAFLNRLLDIDNIRDIRLATKALMGLPQHWLADDVVEGVGRVATTARERGVSLAIHTHVNSAQSVTPAVAAAAKAMLQAGVRDVRNQGVLMRGINDSVEQLFTDIPEAVRLKRPLALEPALHGDPALQDLVLLVDEAGEGLLGDRDERRRVGDLEQREVTFLRLLDQGFRQLAVAEAGAEAEPGEVAVGEQADEGALLCSGVERDAGGQHQLAAGEPGGRVLELGDVDPAHRGAGGVGAGRKLETEFVEQALDREHRGP